MVFSKLLTSLATSMLFTVLSRLDTLATITLADDLSCSMAASCTLLPAAARVDPIRSLKAFATSLAACNNRSCRGRGGEGRGGEGREGGEGGREGGREGGEGGREGREGGEGRGGREGRSKGGREGGRKEGARISLPEYGWTQ